MDESILRTVRKFSGVGESCNAFDTDLILLTNSNLMKLFQIGAIERPFAIHGEEETWDALLDGDPRHLDAVQTYVCLQVKKIFDPPSNSFVIEAYDKELADLEWRLGIQGEGGFDKWMK